MKVLSTLITSAAVLAIVIPGMAVADEAEIAGQQEFYKNCAVCHGVGGKGDGPFAEFLREKPKSLTLISERNGGMFPVQKIYDTIAGTKGVRAHGSLEMPIWGERYMTAAADDPSPYNYGAYGSQKHYEEAVRGRILDLIMFLANIQE